MSAIRGLDMIRFCCPRCTGDEFRTVDGGAVGACNGIEMVSATGGVSCGFTWPRRNDWRVFVRIADGGRFVSREQLEQFIGPRGTIRVHVPISKHHPSFAELLHDLLAEAMNRPPTVGVVGTWTRAQQYLALRWASGEVLHAAGVEIARARVRPEFVEEGAGTA